MSCKRKKIYVFLAGALLLLSACGGKGTEAPAVYAVGEDEAVSLDSIVEEDEALLLSIDTPTEEAIAAGMEEYTYHYGKMDDPAAMAAEYIGVLCGREQGFAMTDENNQQLAEEPDLETLTGTVILEKMSSMEPAEGESKKIFRVIVAWSEFRIGIQVSHQEGKILPPPEPEVEEVFQPKAITEQVDYFNTLNPKDLGLEGDNMADYKVYPKEGWVLVDSYSCREMTVYLEDARTGNNAFIGTYFLSSDLQRIYQKTDSGSIVLLDID